MGWTIDAHNLIDEQVRPEHARPRHAVVQAVLGPDVRVPSHHGGRVRVEIANAALLVDSAGELVLMLEPVPTEPEWAFFNGIGVSGFADGLLRLREGREGPRPREPRGAV